MAVARPRRQSTGARQSTATLLLIAVFKLIKGILLLAIGIGAHRLLRHDIAQTVAHWVDILRVDPDNRFIHRLLARVLSLTPAQLRAASVGTFVYSGLLLTEGIGLLLRKRWAEYFTIITTAGLIPIEVYEIGKHVTAAKVGVLIVNVAIVVYLVRRVRKGG